MNTRFSRPSPSIFLWRWYFGLLPVLFLLNACGSEENPFTVNAAPVMEQTTDATLSPESELLSESQSEPEMISCDSPDADFKLAVLALINESRAAGRQCGSEFFGVTAALIWSDNLAQAAVRHSVDMASNNFFSHTGSDGLGIADRVRESGFSSAYVGENIAAGYRSAQAAHNGLLDSSGHCANIMRPSYDSVGAACIVDDRSDFRNYWTFVFGSNN